MQRKILLTLTAASTLALAALLGGALWSTAWFVKSNATANATAQVRTTEAPTPVVPHEIMRKQGKDIRVEYFAHPF